MSEQRNLIIAIALSVAVIFGFQFFYEAPRVERAREEAAQQTEAQREAAREDAARPSAPTAPGEAAPARAASREGVLAQSPRVRIDTPSLHGSISLRGGRIDDLTLADYHVTPDPQSPEVQLLSPAGTAGAYFAEFGWVPAEEGVPVPGPDAEWRAEGEVLSPGKPVTLTWDNDQGLRFTRTVAVDEDYMFTVTQRVENATDAPVTLFPYGLVSRHETPPTLGFFILHEGAIGVLDETLREIDYDDLREENLIQEVTTGGWVGFTDKYWLTAIVPDQDDEVTGAFRYRLSDGEDRYQADTLASAVVVPAGGAAEYGQRLFAGAKELAVLDWYKEAFGIPLFDRAVDFGWFYFITKPIFLTLNFFAGILGNFGLAILLLTVLIKLIFFPLANKSYVAMSKMKKLQPEMMRLREQYQDDRTRMNQELMALYKREKVNPAAGCLPILIQIPVFFALYKVLFVTIEMRHAPFYGWIHDLSAPDPTSIFNLFGLLPYAVPDFLMIGVWPIIMGATMFLQQKLNPAPADPVQAKVFMALPIVFTFLFAQFPAGLVIYWAWNNLLSIAQQWVIMRRMGVKV